METRGVRRIRDASEDNYFEKDLHGFGRVLKTVRTEFSDDIVLVEVNNSGETEVTADRVYPIARNRICKKCSCVVLNGPHEDAFQQPWPYYCPDCDGEMTTQETMRVTPEEFKECLKDSTGRFTNPIED